MKKSNAQLAILAVLILFSLFSYIYLSTRASVQPDLTLETPREKTLDQEEIETKESAEYMLLDIKLVKKVASAIQKLLPASSY